MRLIFTIIFIVALCVMFAAPLGISLIMVGLCFWAVVGYDATLGCLGLIIDIILLAIGLGFIIAGCCAM
ncbi:MAG: hypothetical protein IKU22_01270 [Alistipes sp.]|nr:hypothetical protein [Alistipes sp.]